MIKRSTWIALAIFVILVAAAILIQRTANETESVVPTPTIRLVQPLLYDLGSSALTWIQFTDAEGNLVEVERESASATWVVVGESEETSDSFRIGSIAGQLLTMQAMTTFETALGIETVGLDAPAYTITMRTSAGEEIVTTVGNLTAIGSGYYIQVNDGDVMVVAKLVLDEILGILTEPPLVATPTPEATETAVPELETTSTP